MDRLRQIEILTGVTLEEQVVLHVQRAVQKGTVLRRWKGTSQNSLTSLSETEIGMKVDRRHRSVRRS